MTTPTSLLSAPSSLRCPNEIWLWVIEFIVSEGSLTGHDAKYSLRNLSTVCRHLRALCLPSMFHELVIASGHSARKMLDIVETNPALETFVQKVYLAGQAVVDEGLFDKLCSMGGRIGLRRLTICVIDRLLRQPNAEKKLSPSVSSVEHLRISFEPQDLADLDIWFSLISKASVLVKLDLFFPVAGITEELACAPLPTTLQHLLVQGSFTPRVYASLLQNTHHLETLQIYEMHFVASEEDLFLDAMQAISPNLTSLHLIRSPWYGAPGPVELVAWNSCALRLMQQCTRLSSLLINHMFCEPATIAALPATLVDLELTCQYCRERARETDKVAYDGFCSAVLRCRAPGLKSIHIRHGFRLNHRDVEVECELQKTADSAGFISFHGESSDDWEADED